MLTENATEYEGVVYKAEKAPSRPVLVETQYKRHNMQHHSALLHFAPCYALRFPNHHQCVPNLSFPIEIPIFFPFSKLLFGARHLAPSH